MNPSGRVFFTLLVLLNYLGGQILASDALLLNGNNRVAESSKRAASWLLNRRNSQLHWGRLVNSQALLALSRSDVFNSSLPEFQLAIKQVDLDFLLDRLRHGELELYSDRLIPLAVSLTSQCRSPTHYYDYDLLDGLLDYRRKTNNFTFAMEMLAVCGGDGVIRRVHIRRLVWLLNPKMWTSPAISFDTLSMVLMATGCVAEHYDHPYLLPFADKIAEILISKQERDGSFGKKNIVSTAMAIEALQIRGLSVNVDPTIRASIDWLISIQMEDGSFDSDLMATSEALLALSPKGGRSYIHMSQCSGEGTTPRNPMLNDVPIEIQIWIGEQPSIKRQTIHLQVPVNSTIYEALLLAQADGLLRFETKEYSFGHYLLSINNTSEVYDASNVQQGWVIFIFPSADVVHKPDAKYQLKKSVSAYKITSGDRILFWHRNINRE
ncbi:cobalamin-binding-like protein [Daphnia sinensis]|uniref:Cobalamin-binding-like protein n=1 Tax=Daphnia sinensis TaxID=1820382 RepID=A0AAD5KQ75_9CRUS|nr:cobalamin-binding-like protein [Daphnia sinensis]